MGLLETRAAIFICHQERKKKQTNNNDKTDSTWVHACKTKTCFPISAGLNKENRNFLLLSPKVSTGIKMKENSTKCSHFQ